MITRVLVTGGSGFLGSYLVRALVERGLKVGTLLRSDGMPERLQGLEKKLHIIRGCVSRPDDWIEVAKIFAPEAVVHMSWLGVAGSARNDPAQADNISATVKLAATMQTIGAKHFIGAGSQAEYGPVNRICDEATPPAPTTLYGHAKLAAYRMTEMFCDQQDLRFAWLRIFSTYGPDDHDHWLIPYLMREMLAGRTPQLTRCAQRWDYLHARDAAAAFVSVLLEERAAGIFNLGSGEALPLVDTVKTIRDLINPSLALGLGEVPYKPDQIMHLQADIARLTNTTGWKPQISLPEGLRETVAWYAARTRK